MIDTLSYVHQHVLPAAYALLPTRMQSRPASAMLLAIGIQESVFRHRVQLPHGPAHGFWQFEKGGGVHGVLTHQVTGPLLRPVLQTLRYPDTTTACYAAITHHDVLAAVFARLLLWTIPSPLPTRLDPAIGYAQYLRAWAPGKPRPETWDACFNEAWRIVDGEPT